MCNLSATSILIHITQSLIRFLPLLADALCCQRHASLDTFRLNILKHGDVKGDKELLYPVNSVICIMVFRDGIRLNNGSM